MLPLYSGRAPAHTVTFLFLSGKGGESYLGFFSRRYVRHRRLRHCHPTMICSLQMTLTNDTMVLAVLTNTVPSLSGLRGCPVRFEFGPKISELIVCYGHSTCQSFRILRNGDAIGRQCCRFGFGNCMSQKRGYEHDQVSLGLCDGLRSSIGNLARLSASLALARNFALEASSSRSIMDTSPFRMR